MKQLWRVLVLFLVVVLLCGCAKEKLYKTEDAYGKEWTVNTRKRTITDGEDTYKYKLRGDGEEYTLVITYPNEYKYFENKVGGVVNGVYDPDPQVFIGYNFWNEYADGASLSQMIRRAHFEANA